MKHLPFFLFILITTTTFGQSNEIDCNKLQNEIPLTIREKDADSTEAQLKKSLQFDYSVITKCSNFDTLDKKMLLPTIINGLLLEYLSEKKPITYGIILDRINQFRNSIQYGKMRKLLLAQDSIFKTTVTAANFEKSKNILLQTGILDTSDVTGFKNFLQAHQAQTMTYGTAYLGYSGEKNKLNSGKKNKPDLGIFLPFVNINSAVRMAQREHKRTLIYFSGHSCVNARKIESGGLSNDSVKALLENNFLCFIAYVDDRSIDSKTHTSKGKYYLKIENKQFKVYGQPYFFILDNTGKVISKTGYTDNPDTFIAFLKKGLP